ncbi:MAG: flagellar biosynthesis protein FlhF [Hydrogenophaga sp.]|uniref:flagellar biosynthesis protein FlhF n=1 Tax=Hydrogenophaga sp. TaxID=1904254 RepID=UPI001E0288B0|nr:flagellar biosynthesis protein FlhF [Hydrogenophaga sp.]MBX3609697.1 flagellar biosynthesis protein FlhF [Hydrogenophaga sp.]
MNIQRFIAPTSREAMSKARRQFGDSAVILSTRQTPEGFEVMVAAEESLASMTQGAPASAASAAAAKPVEAPRQAPFANTQSTIASDTEAMAMSTLSFQEYVRERMLRKRREQLDGGSPEAAAEAAPAREPEPIAVPVQRFNEPEQIRTPRATPQPIRTRENAFADSEPRFAVQEEQRMSLELNALKDMIEERFNTLAWLGSSKSNPIQSSLMHKLIRAGYSPALSRAVLERLPVEAGAGESLRWLMDAIQRNLRVAQPGAGLADEGGVVALVGATGVGKTTTAAKLAAQCVKQYGANSVGLVTLDSYRVSGYEQLRSFGRMLGVVAHLAHDRAALKDMLGLLAGKRLVIIDTAGLGQRDQRVQDMLDVLEMPSLKKVLVLNAGTQGDTLDETLSAFKADKLHGVVLSKVDEAVKLGPAIDALIRHHVTVRGVANGQRVPEDWHHPDAGSLVKLSMGSSSKSAFDPSTADMGFYFAQSAGRSGTFGGLHV